MSLPSHFQLNTEKGMFKRSLKGTLWVGRGGYFSAKPDFFKDFCKCTEEREHFRNILPFRY